MNLAAQAISSSVADAIEFCDKKMKLDAFKDSGPTVTFIRTFDRLFDILNSRNPCAKGYKSPLKKENKHLWLPFIEETYKYIKGLKSLGKLICTSKRKTGK